jgi:hypothetical protein
MEKFFCDDTLGKLARKLRLLGFDTKLWDGRVEEDRILLTRSRKRWESYEGESFLLFADTWRKQLEELERRYSINTKAKPFTRCAECNSVLLSSSAEEVKDRIPERVYLTATNFKVCPKCGKVYWSGTHVERIREEFEKIFGGSGKLDR